MQPIRFSPQSPKKIDKTVGSIIAYLALGAAEAVHLKFTKPTTFEPEPDFCHFNAWLQAKSFGGKPQSGWVLAQDKQKSFAEAIFHTVWLSPDNKLVDVTPRKDSEKRLLFVPDRSRSIVLASHEGRPAIHTYDNVRLLSGALMTPLTEVTIVMESDFPQRHGLWPW